MENVNIVMTRIDERLLHGQGQLWVRYLGANTVLVVNDKVSNDPIQQSLMRSVVGNEIALRFFSVDKTIEIISKANPKQKIFIVIKDCADAYRLIAGGVPIKHINIGNIHNGEGKEKITRSIFIGDEDKTILKKLHVDFNITFDTKTTPSGADGSVEVDITKYI